MLEHLGSETLVYARGSASDLLTIAQEPHCALVAGDRLTARFRPSDALLFDSDSGRRIY
jgi:lactose/L-arabinose transport system ATP-binding protein